MRRHWLRALGVATLGMAASGAVGCATERAPINRVQPNAIAKSFFVGANLQDDSDNPEFWSQGTVVDVGYGAAQDGLFTSTYAQPLSRIKWVIQEDLLVGRLSYERIEDTDGKGIGDKADEGVIVVAYPITSHFDIRRDYNPATGEESNVVAENTSDRPWNEREYIRVDWSRNLNVDSYDFDTLSMMGIYGGLSYESLSYYVNDPESPDAPHFSVEDNYFDVTNKAFAVPGVVDLSYLGWGIDKFPACFLPAEIGGGTSPVGTCNPVEITIRQSFRKIDPEAFDYEPVDYDGGRFQAYGIFMNDRWGYARNYGMTDDRRHRFMNRYDIWEKSHASKECYSPKTTPYGSDPNRDDDADGIVDECASVGAGSHCDTFNQKCTIPYTKRTSKPIAWYYTAGSHPDFFEATEWATHEWDVAMRSAVNSAKYAECTRYGGDSAGCQAKYPVWFGQQDQNEDAIAIAKEVDTCRHAGKDEKGCKALAAKTAAARGLDANDPSIAAMIKTAQQDEMIVLCHSPVADKDPELCGERGMVVRIGDLRYHQVNSIAAPQTPSPWGIMVDAIDPVTGMTVSSSINIWTHVNDLASQGVVDQARYLAGELKTGDVTNGTYVQDWSTAAESASSLGAMGTLDDDAVKNRLHSAARELGTTPEQRAAQWSGAAKPTLTEAAQLPVSPAQGQKMRKEIQRKIREFQKDVRAELGAPSQNRAFTEARRKLAVGTDIEAELLTPAMQQMAGVGDLPLNDTVLNAASVLRGANPAIAGSFRNMKEMALAKRGACMIESDAASAVPIGIPALARVLQQKFGAFNADDPKHVQGARAERMQKYLAQRMQYNVILHEMGHSIGLRHNFVSSSDAFNFRPQYWQLRTQNGEVRETCKTATADGSTCVGPRYFDPVTSLEREQLLEMFMQSSVMDYAGELSQDLLGLGNYDFAATRMFYGDVVSVFKDPSFRSNEPRGQGAIAKMDSFGGLLGFRPQIGDKDIHYSELNNHYDLIQNCQVVDPAKFKPSTWNEKRDGVWHPLGDGLLVGTKRDPATGEILEYSRCQTQPVDYVAWNALRAATPLESGEAGGNLYSRAAKVAVTAGPLAEHVRVPHGFASDEWADLGNAAVYRHDNGADPYEFMMFMISQQEVGHIFDNYRRNRATFSIRGGAMRTFGRYSEKMRDLAKGMGLFRNLYRDFAVANPSDGFSPNDYWDFVVGSFPEVVLASGVAFDHFARQLSRPEVGPHCLNQRVLRSSQDDRQCNGGPTAIVIPNGAVGYNQYVNGEFLPGGGMTFGGRLIENRLDESKFDYAREYDLNVGSYYDKVYVPMLLTESEDNFISASRKDFVDARERNISIADVFPDGFRRMMANMLTGDEGLKGHWVASNVAGGAPIPGSPNIGPADQMNDCSKNLVGEIGPGCAFPQQLGWTTWWTQTPEVCFPGPSAQACSVYGDHWKKDDFKPNQPAATTPVDAQVGWEQQKFLIAMSLMNLPENAKRYWLDQMQIFELGEDGDPGFPNRIEFHDPFGHVYIAKTIGTETIFGKKVQMGIGARILEHANELLKAAFATTPVTSADGATTWYVAQTNTDGSPKITGCSPTETKKCSCDDSSECGAMLDYVSVPMFMRKAMDAFHWTRPGQKGIY